MTNHQASQVENLFPKQCTPIAQKLQLTLQHNKVLILLNHKNFLCKIFIILFSLIFIFWQVPILTMNSIFQELYSEYIPILFYAKPMLWTLQSAVSVVSKNVCVSYYVSLKFEQLAYYVITVKIFFFSFFISSSHQSNHSTDSTELMDTTATFVVTTIFIYCVQFNTFQNTRIILN